MKEMMEMEKINDRELRGVRRVRHLRRARCRSLTYYGLHALQHRGQEGAGIVAVGDDGRLRRIARGAVW